MLTGWRLGGHVGYGGVVASERPLGYNEAFATRWLGEYWKECEKDEEEEGELVEITRQVQGGSCERLILCGLFVTMRDLAVT